MYRTSISVFFLRSFLSACIAQTFLVGFCSADEKCADTLFQKKLATAATFSNLRNSAGSLRFESKQMLVDAESKLKEAKPTKNSCPATCSPNETASIVFTSTPNKFLEKYGDAELCSQLFKKTTAEPLRYDQGSFKDLESFSDQFSQFSQGKGESGADLYSKCSGACSPRYTTILKKTPSGYAATTSVVCGPARDKDDNQYELTTSFRWTCGGR